MLKKIPHVKSYSPLGSLTKYVVNPLNFLVFWKNELGDIFSFRVAHRKLLVVSNPQYIQHILLTNYKNYKKSLAYTKLQLLLGQGLFTSEGSFWVKQRKLAQPAFHKKRLDGYLAVMLLHTEKMIKKWEENFKENQIIDITNEMTAVTLKIVSDTLMSKKLDRETKIIEEHFPYALKYMIKKVTSAINFPVSWPTPANLKFKRVVRKLEQQIYAIIKEKKNSNNDTGDLLSMLMMVQDDETGERMSDAQLKDEILTFLLAGHETSAIAMSWTLYLLSKNPNKEAVLREEIESVLNGKTPDSGNLDNLPYTQQVIQESMRMISPIWGISREAINDDLIDGYPIKRGDSIVISPYLVHLDEKIWEQPDSFSPERFAPDKVKVTNKFDYFPFGSGPRMCIGNHFAMMELKVLLILIIQNFRLAEIKGDEVEFECSLTLRPKNGVKLKLMRIKKKEEVLK